MDQAEKNFRNRCAAERELAKSETAYKKGVEDGRDQILKENVIRAKIKLDLI